MAQHLIQREQIMDSEFLHVHTDVAGLTPHWFHTAQGSDGGDGFLWVEGGCALSFNM
jgi:hypothetical protein